MPAAVLNLEPAIESPDDFYEALLDAHQGLSDAQSAELNARLVLVLANQVSRLDLLREAIAVARQGLAP
jgi:Protein of unknown function (DUF2783)